VLPRRLLRGSGSHPTAGKLASEDVATQALLPPRPAGVVVGITSWL